MDIRELFKKEDNYFGRRLSFLFLFQAIAWATLIVNAVFASGWLDGIFGQYLPPSLSLIISLFIVIVLELIKKISAVFLVKEFYKYSIIDAIAISALVLFFTATLSMSIVGIDAKQAKDTLKGIVIEKDTIFSTSKENTNLLGAKNLREQTKGLNAAAAASIAASKLDSTKFAISEKKAAAKEKQNYKIEKLKSKIFSVNKFFIVVLEILFLYACFVIGFLQAQKPDKKTYSIEDVKKLKARYSAAHARYKKTNEQKEFDLMQEIENELQSIGENIPNTRP